MKKLNTPKVLPLSRERRGEPAAKQRRLTMNTTRFARLLLVALMAVLAVPAQVGTATPLEPVSIVTQIDFSEQPFTGTFQVTSGADILGCRAGTFADYPTGVAVRKVFTCTSGGTGTFVALFQIVPRPGPAVLNGHWTILSGTADFAGLHGSGDFALVTLDPVTLSGSETLTGGIHFEP